MGMPLQKPWMVDEELQAYVNAARGGSPLSLMNNLSKRPEPEAEELPPPKQGDTIGNALGGALNAFDNAHAQGAAEPQPTTPEPAPEDPAATTTPNYFPPGERQLTDDERPPIAQAKPEPKTEEYKPDKGWRVVDAIASAFAGRPYDSAYWTGVDNRHRQEGKEAEAKGELAKRKDPGSAISRRMQAMAASFLEASGMTPEQIRGLSAEDLKSFDPVNIAKFKQEQQTRIAKGPRPLSNDPASKESEQARADAVRAGVDPKRVEGLSEEAINKTWRPMLTAQTTQQSGHENIIDRMHESDELARARMDKSYGQQHGLIDYRERVETKHEIGKEERAANKERDAANVPIGGVRVLDQDAYTEAMRDPVVRRKMQDGAASYSVLMENLDRMEQLRQKYGVELFRGGAKGEYETAQTLAIGAITSLAASGVLNGTEFERYKKMLPSMDPEMEDLVPGVDIKLNQLRGARRAIDGAVQANLRVLHAGFETPQQEALRLGEEEFAAKQAAAATRTNASPAPNRKRGNGGKPPAVVVPGRSTPASDWSD